MKKNNTPSLRANVIYSFLYQFLILALPMATLPYISRILGSENIGIYSYTQAFANYFFLFSMLGILTYGNRSIASVRDNINDLSVTFWELFTAKLIPSLIMAAGYMVFCSIFIREYKLIYYLHFFYIFSSAINIRWFCFGMEQFRLTTVISTIIQFTNTFLIFVFVKSANDLWIYTLIISLSYTVSDLILWRYVLKTTHFVKVKAASVFRHAKGLIVLFVPIVAESIYNLMDKLMLGFICAKQDVGFYEFAVRIVLVPVAILTALDNVIMPRMAYLHANGDTKKASDLMDSVMMFISAIGCALAFGLTAVGKEFAIIFYGKEYSQTGLYITLLSPAIIFKCLSGGIRMQYIIPANKDSIYVISIVSGAIVNFAVNITLIPILQGTGAIIGTLAAESFVMFLQLYLCRHSVNTKKYIIDCLYFSFIGLIMYYVVKLVARCGLGSITRLILQILAGTVIYLILAGVYIMKKKPVLLYNEISGIIKNR